MCKKPTRNQGLIKNFNTYFQPKRNLAYPLGIERLNQKLNTYIQHEKILAYPLKNEGSTITCTYTFNLKRFWPTLSEMRAQPVLKHIHSPKEDYGLPFRKRGLNHNLNTYIQPKNILAYPFGTKNLIKNFNTYIQAKRILAYPLGIERLQQKLEHKQSSQEQYGLPSRNQDAQPKPKHIDPT